MTDYDNTNRFYLKPNTQKQSDSSPDYKGYVNVDGTEFWMSGWVGEKDGKRYMSGSIKLKEDAPPRPRPRPAEAPEPTGGFFDDDVPF